MEDTLPISRSISIPLDECEFTYARSGGPGGQNVNKVNSKAVLRWNVLASVALPEAVRARFLARYQSRLTVDGDIIITSQGHREQARNVAECLEKLREMIASIVTPPKPRRATRPTVASRRRRVDEKRSAGQKKRQRRRTAVDD